MTISSTQSMLIITSSWGQNKTFKMIPVLSDCPYNEAIYDPENQVLAVVSKQKKETFHMMPKLNELGDPQTLKIGKRENGKNFAEQRVSLDTFYEYFIEEPSEIRSFINRFAINADTYELDQHMVKKTELIQTAPLILS
jgi:hypothetical protein